MRISPNLSVLPPPQLKLWQELDAVPEWFTLYGGTALALRLGHRSSVDFHFFSNRPFDPEEVAAVLPFLGGAQGWSLPQALYCVVARGGCCSRRSDQASGAFSLREATRRTGIPGMKALPPTAELLYVARRVVWFKDPHDALADPLHFLAHVMTYGTIEDLMALEGFVRRDELCEVLKHAPPGISDPRSWAYWNLIRGNHPAPDMPRRPGLE